MTDRGKIDVCLERLARADRVVRPRPDAALVARVLADAAAISHGSARDATSAPSPAGRRRPWIAGLAAKAWICCGAAAMAGCLILGLGIGYVLDSRVDAIAGDARGYGPALLVGGGDFVLAEAGF